MKEKLTKNLGLKILSLSLAVLLWIVILNIDNPVITETFRDIPVTIINEQSLEEKDKTFEITKGRRIDVKVKGKRSIIESLTTSSFQAVADLSMLSITSVASIDITVPRYRESVEIIDTGDYKLKVSLENRSMQQFRVEVVEHGTVAEGYYIKEKIARPNMIQVSGAETVINTIAEVVVDVDVSNQSENMKVKKTPKVYDKNGAVIDATKLKLNYEEVEVAVNLLKTKEVPLIINVTGEPFYGYRYTSLEYEPKTVKIAGEESELRKVSAIRGEYNVNYKQSDFQGEVRIEDFIKEDVILIDDNKIAVIDVKVEKLESKEINVDADSISLRNVPEGYEASFDLTRGFKIKVHGESDALKEVTPYSMTPFIDLADATEGENYVKIQLSTDLEYSTSNIAVNLIKKTEP